jgi:hypothetical protein
VGGADACVILSQILSVEALVRDGIVRVFFCIFSSFSLVSFLMLVVVSVAVVIQI